MTPAVSPLAAYPEALQSALRLALDSPLPMGVAVRGSNLLAPNAALSVALGRGSAGALQALLEAVMEGRLPHGAGKPQRFGGGRLRLTVSPPSARCAWGSLPSRMRSAA